MRFLILLVSCALCLTACNRAGNDVARNSLDSAPADESKVSNTNIAGLTKVGDLPTADDSASAIHCTSELVCWVNTRNLLWLSVDGGKSWREIYRTPNVEEILNYVFIDAERGWSHSFNNLHRTDDGGKTWAKHESPIDDPKGQLRLLWFLGDGKTGWLAGGRYRDQTNEELKYGVPNNAKDVTGRQVLQETIFRTNDGGKTWQRQALPQNRIGRILRIQFLNEKQGMALGERLAYLTEDGGTNWKPISFNKSCVRKEYLNEDYEASPDNVEMLDSKLFWISYSDGRIVKSEDGGRHWCDMVQPGQIAFESKGHKLLASMHFDSAEHGWGLGSDRHLYETRDGGKTWTRVSGDLSFNGMTFLGTGRGFLISDKSVYTISR
jgi:photosystem II stability/assembly factor-like uncharacterized protein